LFTLPQDYCPGSDVMSRIMLQDERIIDMVVKTLIGDHVSNSTYTLGRCQWVNKTISDVVYLPKIQSVPPVLIEIQQKVNEDFLSRVIKYCLSLKEEHGVLPVMLIISVKGFTNKDFLSQLVNNNNHYLDTIPCQFWAKECYCLSSKSIEYHLSQNPLNPLVAIGHFFTQQKKSILFIDKKFDPSIKLLYKIAKEKFENECQVEEEKLEVIKDLSYKAKKQFQKILISIENEESIDKVVQYAKDGEEFFYRQERKFNGQIREVTPIEDTLEITDLFLPQPTNTVEKNNFEFIEQYKAKNYGRMRWEACYNKGKEQGFFTNYASHVILKSAYHNENTKLRKRNRSEISQ
ncbi:hypothetical protein BDF21DRAFT_352390, partial [Thamnidium elegans]